MGGRRENVSKNWWENVSKKGGKMYQKIVYRITAK
jgi:hypothetical protein